MKLFLQWIVGMLLLVTCSSMLWAQTYAVFRGEEQIAQYRDADRAVDLAMRMTIAGHRDITIRPAGRAEEGDWGLHARAELPKGAVIRYVRPDKAIESPESGTLEHPVVYMPSGPGLVRIPQISIIKPLRHVWFVRLDIVDGVRIIGQDVEDLNFVDCRIRDGSVNINVSGWVREGTPAPLRNLTFRKCRILDAANNWRSQGGFFSRIDGLVIEDCVFDHNGFNAENPPNDRSHNLYISYCKNVVVRGNVFSRASSFAIKISSDRPAGTENIIIEKNLIVGSPNAISIGNSNAYADFATAGLIIRDNVVTRIGGTIHQGDGPNGPLASQSYGIDLVSVANAQIEGNVLIDKPFKDSQYAIRAVSDNPQQDVKIHDNWIVGWNGPAISTPDTVMLANNVIRPLQPTDKTLQDFATERGLTSINGLIMAFREGQTGDLTATAAIDYIKRSLEAGEAERAPSKP